MADTLRADVRMVATVSGKQYPFSAPGSRTLSGGTPLVTRQTIDTTGAALQKGGIGTIADIAVTNESSTVTVSFYNDAGFTNFVFRLLPGTSNQVSVNLTNLYAKASATTAAINYMLVPA